MASKYTIKGIDYDNIIGYFITELDNGTNTIANKFNLDYDYVNYIIDFHLSLKQNYIGDFKKFDKKGIPKGYKIKVTDLDTEEQKMFNSCSEAGRYYKINHQIISKAFIKSGNNVTIKHRSIKKTLLYRKI